MKRTWTDEQLIQAVADSKSVSQATRHLGLAARGGNHGTVKRRIQALGLDTSHFEWTGATGEVTQNRYTLEAILVVDSPYVNSSDLKKRLVKDGILRDECQKCGLTDWLGEHISLELDHVNGTRTDNRIENLRILCPNCHSQTPTFRGKSRG